MDLSASQIAFAIRQITISEITPSTVIADLLSEPKFFSPPVRLQISVNGTRRLTMLLYIRRFYFASLGFTISSIIQHLHSLLADQSGYCNVVCLFIIAIALFAKQTAAEYTAQ